MYIIYPAGSSFCSHDCRPMYSTQINTFMRSHSLIYDDKLWTIFCLKNRQKKRRSRASYHLASQVCQSQNYKLGSSSIELTIHIPRLHLFHISNVMLKGSAQMCPDHHIWPYCADNLHRNTSLENVRINV